MSSPVDGAILKTSPRANVGLIVASENRRSGLRSGDPGDEPKRLRGGDRHGLEVAVCKSGGLRLEVDLVSGELSCDMV